MKTVRQNEQLPKFTKTVITVGNFDGIHRGHRHLFSKLIERGKALGVPTVVVTFEPHTKLYFDPDHTAPLLSTFDEKSLLLKELGVDYLVALKFDREIAEMGADEFIEKIMIDKLKAVECVMGKNHHFGAKKSGSHKFQHNKSGKNHFNVVSVDLHGEDSKIASSTLVRELITNDRIDEAVELLGRPYPIIAERRGGVKKGSEMGYPTFNFSCPPSQKFIPRPGVYAAEVEYGGRKLFGALYFGNCPTFSNRDFHFEFHSLEQIDKDPDLGESVTLWVSSFIRHDETFDCEEKLIDQIRKDVIEIKEYFTKE